MNKTKIKILFFVLTLFLMPVFSSSAAITEETLPGVTVRTGEIQAPQYGCCVTSEDGRYSCRQGFSVSDCMRLADEAGGVRYINYLQNDQVCKSQQAMNYCSGDEWTGGEYGSSNQAGNVNVSGGQSEQSLTEGSLCFTYSGAASCDGALVCKLNLGQEQLGIGTCLQASAAPLVAGQLQKNNGASCTYNAECESGVCAREAHGLSVCQSSALPQGSLNASGGQGDDFAGINADIANNPAAQNQQSFFSGIVPCGRSPLNPDNPASTTVPCTLCHLVVGIQQMLTWGLTIFIPIAILMLTIAGVMYTVSAGNQGMMETSKKFIWSVAIGVGFILGGWLIVTTMLNVLGVQLGELREESSSSIVVEKWYQFSCDPTSTSRAGSTPATPAPAPAQ